VYTALLAAVVALAWSVLEARPARAAPAQDLTARVVCQAGALTVSFAWTAAGSGQQWLDIGRQETGFAPGAFTGIGPLGAAAAGYEWANATPGTAYVARVNTFDGRAWAATPALQFTAPACGLAAPSAAMESLRASIAAEVAAWSFDTAVAVTDLQTGETVSVNGDRPQLTGCAINLFVLMQSTIDVQDGRYPEAQVGDLIAATIYGSNPVTARDLLHIAGNGDIVAAMERVNVLLAGMGLTSTYYDHPPAYWPAPSLRGLSNMTTALDMNRALAAFWRGEVMSFEWRDYLFDKLTGVKPGLNYLIQAGVTDGVTGHKNGFFWLPEGYIDNDTGIVTFVRGGQTYAYALTFLTQGVGTKYADIPLGQAVSSLVWNYFSAAYQ
jgi:hypothetical protein